MGGGVPGRGAFGAQGFDDVAEVQADHHLFIGGGLLGDLEDVGEGVVAGFALDDLDRTLAMVLERAEDSTERGSAHLIHHLLL
ncbi:hypothetical protein D3C81_1924040 [compost metagenome]